MEFFWRKKKRVYLDHAATTPVSSSVHAAMEPYWQEHFGNPGSLHAEGRRANEALKHARTKCARLLSTRENELTFTSGGTEANNLALGGCVEALRRKGRAYRDMHVVTSPIEHPSVLDTVHALAARGVHVSKCTVDEEGRIHPDALLSVLRPETVLVSLHLVNGEIGVVQPLRKLARTCRAYEKKQSTKIYMHTDASQAPSFYDCTPSHMDVDLLTLDAQKMYGPKGVGLLYHRHNVPLVALLYGGGQEEGLRPGTEPVPLIVGFTQALDDAVKERLKTMKRLGTLRDFLWASIQKELPDALLNGSAKERAPHNLNISIPHVDAEYLIVRLDHVGFALSTRSACLSKKDAGSYVVAALGHDNERARSSIRITLGRDTTKRELLSFASTLKTEVKKLTKH